MTEPPTAVLAPRGRPTWIWVLPALALLFAVWLGYKSWSMRGIHVTVQLDDGSGLRPGGDLRCRGISVGTIDAVTLLPEPRGVLVQARLNPSARHLARAGTRFWVVKPQVQLTRVAGLETLIGPRYLAVSPSPDDQPFRSQRDFVGLANAPIVESMQAGDLEIILHAPQRGSLHPGAPVNFRQTRIGTILSVAINSDGSAVEARVHIQQPFAPLIRPNTRFWDVGGIQAKLGLTGLSIDVDSAEALLMGGVALATPPPHSAGGDVVRTGHRFAIVPRPEEEWLAWQPTVAIGSALLPPGVSPPTPLRAAIGWKQGRFGGLIRGERGIQGWVLQTTDGLLGPADLFKTPPKADAGTAVLEVAGVVVPLENAPEWERNGLALLKASVVNPPAPWSATMRRTTVEPEECLLIADPADDPMPLAAARLVRDGEQWVIDPAVPISAAWHGACVISRADGKLLGMVLVTTAGARVALLR